MIVFLSHLGFMGGHPGGFGVTVFFALSGYLITGLIIREWQKYGNVSLKRFYARRTVRIFPAMYVALAVCIIMTTTHLLDGLPRLWADGLPRSWAIVMEGLYLGNYTSWYGIITNTQYVVPATNQFWSLCVEEHFYLLFPALFCYMLRRNVSFRKIISILASVCLVVLIWRFVAVHVIPHGEDWCYRTSDARMDSILWGCCLACIEQVPEWTSLLTRRLLEHFLVPIGVLILLTTFLFHDQGRMTVRFTAQAVALMPVIYYCVHFPDSFIVRPLNNRVLVHVGVLSYSLYLIHLVTIGICELHVHGGKAMVWVSSAVLTWAAGFSMHWTVERPFERLRTRLRRT
jgi:peptidoglycan/LPS O-acetylase OafA/YrhL